jgi:hypothetical protein
VLFGRTSGLTVEGAEFWHQNKPNVEGVAQEGDAFSSGSMTLD